MSHNLGDLHRSRLETMLAVEIEYQKKLLALSNQRIQALKKLLADVDALHVDVEGDAVLLAVAQPPTQKPTTSIKKTDKAEKKKKSKPNPPTKPAKLVAGKVPRLIDALQMVIRNGQMRPMEVLEALRAKGWLPKKSKDPLGYIRFTLSDRKDIFIRVEGQRGLYELDPDNPYYSGRFSAQSKSSRRSTPDEVEDPPESSTVRSTPKASVAPFPLREGEAELPPAITDEDSRNTVDEILEGRVPLD